MKNNVQKGKRPLCILLLLAAYAVLFMNGCRNTEQPNTPENTDLAAIALNLPDSFYLEATVLNTSGFGSTKSSYALSRSDGWIYVKLGDDREQYVYKPISDRKYIEYKYSTEKRQFLPTMISEALQTQIDQGNVPLDSVSVGKESVDAKIRIIMIQNITDPGHL